MLKVNALAYDNINQRDLAEVFIGYFPVDYIEEQQLLTT